MKKKNHNKIAVCLTCHNYGRYLEQSIKSLLNQSHKNLEIYLFLEECVDNSLLIAKKFQKEKRIKLFIHKKKRGLQFCANKALKLTDAKYFTRLDADDYLHKRAYEFFLNEFNKDKNLALVYSDYFYIDENGNIIDVNFNINKTKKDNPAHGACSVFVIDKFIKHGGYKKFFKAQDGYDLWLSFLTRKYRIKYLELPLWYYRQHALSLSKNEKKILKERSKIKKFYLNKKVNKNKIAYIVGGVDRNNFLLKAFNGKKLIEHPLDVIKKVSQKKNIYISTHENKIIDFSKKNNFQVILRPKNLKREFVTVNEIIIHAKKYIKKKFKKDYEIFIFINSFNPFLSKEYIDQGLDHLQLFNCDNVIATYEDFDLHYYESEQGLETLVHKNHSLLRIDRQALYVDSRMYRILWSKNVNNKLLNNNIKSNIGKIIIPRAIAHNIRSMYDLWIAEKIIKSNFVN